MAVILVMLAHFYPAEFPGGYIGVSIFFVLSGFLITNLLIEETGRSGTVNFVAFWERRARRLLPALVMVVLVTMVSSVVVSPQSLHPMALSALGALAYVSNWFTLNGAADFSSVLHGRDPLGHVWSLAVEEQIYLVAPVLIWAATRTRTAGWVAGVAVGGFVTFSYVAWWGEHAAYLGTPFRSGEVAAGALLAFYRHRTLNEDRTSLVSLPAAAIIGVMSAFLLTVFTLTWYWGRGTESWSYASPLMALLSVLMVAVVIEHPGPMANPVLVWVGKRSYGLYLWHYAIQHVTGWPPWMAVISTLVVVEASYRWVEVPIVRRTGFGAKIERPLVTLVGGTGLLAIAMLGVALVSSG